MKFLRPVSLLALALATVTVQQAHANWSYSSPTGTGSCASGASVAVDSTGSTTDFQMTTIVNRALNLPGAANLNKMTFVMDSAYGKTDIIFTSRNGQIYYYHANGGKVDTIGNITGKGLSTANEDGLIGVAVRQKFDNRIYLHYSHKVTTCNNTATGYSPVSSCDYGPINGSFRVSQFTMDPTTHVIDTSSEKVLLDIPSYRNRWHTSGAMQFDNAGNLFIAVGDNETVFMGPGNTHDLRGNILRIHPNTDGTYSIPSGNFNEYMANAFDVAGRTATAAVYRDTSKVRPEIYVKGTRNAYSINVDAASGQLSYSQCGPDQSMQTEVQNNTRVPIFGGWPFYAGQTTIGSAQLGSGQYTHNLTGVEPASTSFSTYINTNRSMPVNSWVPTAVQGPAKGADSLPPAVIPKAYYTESCAMGSVIIKYNKTNTANTTRMPPQMNNVWLLGDYKNFIKAAKVDEAGNLMDSLTHTTTGNFFTNTAFHASNTAPGKSGLGGLQDIKMGPDGNVYFMTLGTSTSTNGGSFQYTEASLGIARLDYLGTCQDPGFATSLSGRAQQIFNGEVNWLHVTAQVISVYANGPHEIRITDTQGRVVSSFKGDGRKDYKMPASLGHNGVYFMQVKTTEGIAIRSLSRI